jgi:hypothetical protein
MEIYMKRLIACFVCITLLLPCFYVSGSENIVLSVGQAAAEPGDRVTVPISVDNNPSIANLLIEVEYDAARLRIESPYSITRGDALRTLSFISPNDFTFMNNPFRLLWHSTNNNSTIGVAVNVEFTVLDNAPGGNAYIKIHLLEASDRNTRQFNALIGNGGVEVIGEPEPFLLTFDPADGENIGGGKLEQIIRHGSTVIPPIVERIGFIFDGWIDENGVNADDFSNAIITSPKTFTAQWLRIGAVSTGGAGNVTSEDVTYLARHVVGHTGFEILDKRIANLLGDDRNPTMNDVTMLARWLVGYDFANLQSQLSSANHQE